MLVRCNFSDLTEPPSSHRRKLLQAALQSSLAAIKAASSFGARVLDSTTLASLSSTKADTEVQGRNGGNARPTEIALFGPKRNRNCRTNQKPKQTSEEMRRGPSQGPDKARERG